MINLLHDNLRVAGSAGNANISNQQVNNQLMCRQWRRTDNAIVDDVIHKNGRNSALTEQILHPLLQINRAGTIANNGRRTR